MVFEDPTPVFNGVASTLAVMTNDDLQHGTLVINMGAGTTEYMVFNNFIAKESNVLPIGCDHLVNDLYLGLEIGLATAKKLIYNNMAYERKLDGHSNIEIKGTLRNRIIPISTIERIIELRLAEIFEIIHSRLKAKKTPKFT